MSSPHNSSSAELGPFGLLAREYYEKELSAIPISLGAKKPAIDKWSGYCDNLPSLVTQQKFIKQYRKYGIGIALGREAIPGWRLSGIDVDKNLLSKPVGALLGGPVCAKRGAKGITYFVMLEKGLKTTALSDQNEKHAVDILVSGRQSVIPPTIHPETGRAYEWIGEPLLSISLEALPKIDARKFKLLEILIASAEVEALSHGTGTHDAALQLVAKLVRGGASNDEIANAIAAALPENYEGNTLDELDELIESARAKGFGNYVDLPIDESVARLVSDNLAPLVYVEGDGFRRYRDGYWPKFYTNDIDRVAKDHLLSRLGKGSQVASYLRNVRQMLMLNAERANFGEHTSYLCFKNGTLDVLTGELEAHSPKHELRYRLNFDYDPTATCGLYEKHIEYTLRSDQQSIDLFDEFAGLSLVADMAFQKALYLVGPGGSGKSTLLKLLRAVHDPEAVSATPLDKLNDERYLADVVKKQVCINFDVQTNKQVFGETFMRITGGDPVAIRLLYQEVQGLVVPTVRFVGSMNTDTPTPSGALDALARRLIILECNKKAPQENLNLFAKLSEELPGIVVRWTKAARRLYNRGEFDIPASSITAVNALLFENEPFDTFFTEFLEIDDQAKTRVAEVHAAFNQWAARNGERDLSANVIGKKLRRYNVTGRFMRHVNGEESRTARVVGVRFRINPKDQGY